MNTSALIFPCFLKYIRNDGKLGTSRGITQIRNLSELESRIANGEIFEEIL